MRRGTVLQRFVVYGGIAALLAYAALYLAPLPGAPAIRPLPESTQILDREGRVLYDPAGLTGGRHAYVPLSEIPDLLEQAVVATEDASFYTNPGVDLPAIARAAVTNAWSGELQSGGSTITQQLARNLYFGAGERASASPLRKAKEAVLALRLERSFSKDQVLEMYLNRVYFGNLAYGVEAASRTYFGKGVRDLDLAESAFLAGLLQAPASYDPFTRFDAAKARQAVVLGRMAAEGYISDAEAAAAREEALALNTRPFPIEAPHFVAWVLDQLPAVVGADGLSASGLRVYTSLDLDLQRSAQRTVAWRVGELEDRHVTNGAVVAIDPATGEVLAMVSSADYFDEEIDGAVNVALAERQPGSAIKPVIYAEALESGFTPATPLLDVPTSLSTQTGDPYTPDNYDATFHGVVPLREALASSYNVPAVRVLAAVGVERALEMGRRLGLTTLRDPSRYDLSLTLGGAEVRLLDLTAAYAALANGGSRVTPVAILRVEDSEGNVLYQAPTQRGTRVLSQQTAYLLTDILSDNDARAPGFGYESPLKLGRPAAVKTGTTTDFRDNWTVGYTPDIAVGVWVGNADNSPMRGVSGVDGAAPIWRDVMDAALRTKPVRGFTEPEGIVRAEVCLPSGLLPTPYCQRRRVEVFAEGTVPVERDDYYRPVLVCEPGGDAVASADAPCAGEVRERVFAFVPIEAIPWARGAGVALPPLPPYSSAPAAGVLAGIDVRPELLLVSPPDGLVLRVSRDVRREDQTLRIEAQPAMPVRYVEFYVDGGLLGRAGSAPYQLRWPIVEGAHEVRARAVDRDGNEVWSRVANVTVLPP